MKKKEFSDQEPRFLEPRTKMPRTKEIIQKIKEVNNQKRPKRKTSKDL